MKRILQFIILVLALSLCFSLTSCQIFDSIMGNKGGDDVTDTDNGNENDDADDGEGNGNTDTDTGNGDGNGDTDTDTGERAGALATSEKVNV